MRLLIVLVVLLFVATSVRAYAGPLKVCLISGSFEYESAESLAAFKEYLEREYEAECTFIKANGWTDLPGIEALDDCDVALFFTRRLRIDGEQLDMVKRYVEAGRPIVGVRTASHGFQNWLEMDKRVFGGDYQGHYGKGPTSATQIPSKAKGHPILEGVSPIRSRASLYKNPNIADDTEVLMRGSTPDGNEPIAWTREYKGGRIFYSSLGDQNDFQNRTFLRMLANALFWTAERPVARKPLPEPLERPRPEGTLRFPARTRVPIEGSDNEWEEETMDVEMAVAETAILLCDVWDMHWCRGASARVDELAPKMDAVVKAARDRGVQIIHSPSDTLFFYIDTPQRKRMQDAPHADKPPLKSIEEPPLPIDDSDGGCDTDDERQYSAWTRQHPAVEIAEPDGISDNGDETYNFLVHRGIQNIIYMGVHTNMCVLGRSFAIRNMTRLGMNCYLIRDLTDAMYDPKDRPYVSHEEGTELVVQHIEKYWCPSLLSEDLVRGLP